MVYAIWKIDKLDVDQLVPIPVELNKINDVIKNEVVNKTEYNAKIKDIEDKIPDITNLATNAALNTKINEVKGKIPSITNLATTTTTTTVLIVVENKIPNVSNLVKKTNYNTKINVIENKINYDNDDKYITTQKFNRFKRI